MKISALGIERYRHREIDELTVSGVITFDGHHFSRAGEVCLDWVELTRALLSDGDWFPVTCTCGERECGGMLHPITVRHHGLLTTWTIVSPAGLVPSWAGATAANPARVTFAREAAVATLLETLTGAIKDFEHVVYEHDHPLLPIGTCDEVIEWCVGCLRARRISGSPWT